MWKLIKQTDATMPEQVTRTNEDGSVTVMLTSAQDYLAWLAEGNKPLPADEPQQGQ